jgi:protein TonB
MPASLEARPRERIAALVAVALVQLAVGLALIYGLRVDFTRSSEVAQQLISIVLQKPPPVLPPKLNVGKRARAAPRAATAPPGAAPTSKPVPAPPAPPTPIVAVKPTPAPSAGGSGSGAAYGAGAGGGTGGNGVGAGDDSGGTDLEQIAGEIRSSDYPRDLRERRIGGTVGILFTVGTNGRVTRCSVTRSSGVPELDTLTCRLIQERFVYRPSTDRYGRPVADEVEGEHQWIAR